MHKPFSHLAAVVALSLLFLSATAAVAAAAGSNATRIGDSLLEGEEFLMESETGRRILQGQKPGISYGGLNPKKPVCNGNVHGSCGGKQNKIQTDRKCDYQNHCGRGQ